MTCKVLRMVFSVSVFPVVVLPYTCSAGQVASVGCTVTHNAST